MDIPRERVRSLRPVYLAGGATLLVALLAFGLTRVKPAAPSVEKSGVWIDTVQRGAMLREVKGPGTLVPEHIRWITADTAGRVERIHLRPGAPVKADTLLLELSNPDVMLQALEAERQVSSAEADLLALKGTLATDRLRQEAAVAQLETDAADARRRAEADKKLHARAMLSDIDTGCSTDRANELTERLKLGKDQVQVIQREPGRAHPRGERPAGEAPRGGPVPQAAGGLDEGARRRRRHPPGPAARARAVGHPGHAAGQGRAAGRAEGRAAHPRDAGQGRRARPAASRSTPATASSPATCAG